MFGTVIALQFFKDDDDDIKAVNEGVIATFPTFQ